MIKSFKKNLSSKGKTKEAIHRDVSACDASYLCVAYLLSVSRPVGGGEGSVGKGVISNTQWVTSGLCPVGKSKVNY